MIRFHKRSITKLLAWCLAFLLFHGNWWLPAQEAQEEQLERLFQWAVLDYQGGKYRQVVRNVEPLLSYFDEHISPEEHKKSKDIILKGKIHLLLGATYEKMGNILKARRNYQQAKTILDKREMKIEGIDFFYLEEYQHIIMGSQAPVPLNKGIIEKPTLKPKKKGKSALVLIIGAAVLGGILAAILLKKKSYLDDDRYFDSQTLGISWVWIEGDFFMRGDEFNEGDPDEQPVRSIWVGNYYISRHEITFAQYDMFCEATGREKPYDNGWGRGDRPVVFVSWQDAKDFAAWVYSITKKDIRLPSEAQWERAAKGTEQRRYPWGDAPPDCDKVNYNCLQQTRPVGFFNQDVSPFGVYDMGGNVTEWCRDVYDPEYYATSTFYEPVKLWQDNINVDFVIRGGNWDANWNITPRCADRGYANYHSKNNTIGFRLVWVPHN